MTQLSWLKLTIVVVVSIHLVFFSVFITIFPVFRVANIDRVAGKYISVNQPIWLNLIVVVVPICLVFSVNIIVFVSVVVVLVSIYIVFSVVNRGANIDRVAGNYIAVTQPIWLNLIVVVVVPIFAPIFLVFNINLIVFVSVVVVVSICIVFSVIFRGASINRAAGKHISVTQPIWLNLIVVVVFFLFLFLFVLY